MVIFDVQTTKEAHFLYQTNCNAGGNDVIEEISSIHNAIIRIRAITASIKDLVKSGPLGENNERSKPPENKEVLERAVSDAETAISEAQVKNNVFFTPSYVSEELGRLSGAITIAYPQGLPATDPLVKLIDGSIPIQGEYDIHNCQLWWARKSFKRDKPISDTAGKNEHVKLVSKLTSADAGPPPRDMTMNQDSQIKMMSSLHKKAEELKRIEKDDDDSYLDSEWANPSELKNTFQGLEDVKWH